MRKHKALYWEVEVRVRPARSRWRSTWKGSSPDKKRLLFLMAMAGSRVVPAEYRESGKK